VKKVLFEYFEYFRIHWWDSTKDLQARNWALELSPVVNYVPLECAVELVLHIQPGIAVATNILSCYNIFRW